MLKHWASMRKASREKATSFITRLNEARNELLKKRKEFTNGELVGRLLDGLPGENEYQANVAAMYTIPNLQFEEAVRHLRYKDIVDGLGGEETKMKTVAYTYVKKTCGETKVTCQICNKPGHKAPDCWFKNSKQQTLEENKAERMTNAITARKRVTMLMNADYLIREKTNRMEIAQLEASNRELPTLSKV